MVSSKVGRFVIAGLALSVAVIAPLGAQSTKGSLTSVTTIDRSGPAELDASGNKVPGTGAIFNPCTGEDVNISGTMTTTSSQYLDPQGFIRTSVSVISKGTGTGVLTGTLYPFSETQNFNIKSDPTSLEFVSSFTDKIGLRGPKSIDNWVVRATMKITVFPDGTVKNELTNLSSDVCKG